MQRVFIELFPLFIDESIGLKSVTFLNASVKTASENIHGDVCHICQPGKHIITTITFTGNHQSTHMDLHTRKKDRRKQYGQLEELHS